MNPYLTAWKEFHRLPTELNWSETVSEHLNSPRGIVLSSPDLFALAIHEGAELEVNAAAGDLRLLCSHIPDGVETLVFQRRSERVHRLPVARLLRGLKE